MHSRAQQGLHYSHVQTSLFLARRARLRPWYQAHQQSGRLCVRKSCCTGYFVEHVASIGPSHTDNVRDITLSTQVSLNRWTKLCQQAKCWGGSVSVAAYIPASSDTKKGGSYRKYLDSCVAQLVSACPAQTFTIHALYANHEALEGSDVLGGATASPPRTYDELYPINALRNVALNAVTTDFLLLVDADFLPSPRLRSDALAPETQAFQALEQLYADARSSPPGSLLVVPHFQLLGTGELADEQIWAVPCSIAELRSRAEPFHCGVFRPEGDPLNYSRWYDASLPYEVPYLEFFEPHVIGLTASMPRYDERFKGYGLNKVQHTYAAASSGFRFKVLPQHFLITARHKKSPSWNSAFGTSQDADHLKKVIGMYECFKAEVASAMPAR